MNISSLKDHSKVRSLTVSELLLSILLRMLPIENGKHRLLDMYFPKAWNKSGKEVFVKYRDVKLRINIDELIGWRFAILELFDPEVSEILHRISKDDNEQVFWDIGANKYMCSYDFSYLLPNAKIVAIEPQTSLDSASDLK